MKDFNKAKKHIKKVFIIATSIVLLCSSAIITLVQLPIMQAEYVRGEDFESFWKFSVLIFAVATWIIGSLLSFLAGRILLQPINHLLDGMEKLSGGEYGTRIHLGANKSMQMVADGFNSLASELEHTEIVRSDFINDFSHEFKTPLASIKGLAALMKSGRVPPEKQREYLAIIEDETDRLTMMTTNVLNLSKIQNQQIVVDKSKYNLSEQIRGCLLLFEKRWLEKRLSLSVDMSEIEIFASEELLRHVWVNLIDNAVKFSEEGGEIGITAESEDGVVTVSVSNSGEVIPEELMNSIFHKFYRVETTSSRAGNGIGLSIVKSAVELHSGEVSVTSLDGVNTFSVTLPLE